MNTIISETVLVKRPRPNAGGYLVKKRGEECLRLADVVMLTGRGEYFVTRQWMRPVGGPFSRHIYDSHVGK